MRAKRKRKVAVADRRMDFLSTIDEDDVVVVEEDDDPDAYTEVVVSGFSHT